jgi:hypothetical protein
MLIPRAGTTDPAIWRTRNTTYDAAWQDYVACALTVFHIASGISKLLAPYQITNGGPIILWQVRVSAFRASARPVLTPSQSENEYSGWQSPYSEDFVYEQQLLTAWVRALRIHATWSNAGGIP